MRYLQRDAEGKVVGHYSHPHDYTEPVPVPDDHPEVLAWHKRIKDAQKVHAKRKAATNPERLLKLIGELRQDLDKLKKG